MGIVSINRTAGLQQTAARHDGKINVPAKTEDFHPERKQASTIYGKEKVIVAREDQVGGGEGGLNKFKITTEAESALIDTVEDFIFHLDNPAIATGILDPLQQDFIKQFKGKYGGKSYDPQKLHECATDFIRQTDGSGMVAALVIDEWKIAMYQKALGFKVEEKQGHKVVYRPELHSSGATDAVETEVGRVKRRLLGFIPFGEKDGPVDAPHRKVLKAEREAEDRLPAAERDKNYHWDLKFPPPPQNIEYRFGGLSPGQVAYLKSVGVDVDAGANSKTVVDGPTNGSRDASAEKIRVRHIMDRLFAARNVVYSSLGKDNIDMNLVDVSTPARNYIREPQRFLIIDHKAGTAAGADIKTAIDSRLKYVTGEMKKENQKTATEATKKAKETKKTNEKDRKVNLIKDKKVELSAPPPPPNAEDEKKIKANTEIQAKEETKKTELSQAVEDGKKLSDQKKAVDEAQTFPDFGRVKVLHEPVDLHGDPAPNSLLDLELGRDVAVAAEVAAKAEVENRSRAVAESDRLLSTLNIKINPPEAVQQLVATNQALHAIDMAQLQTDYESARLAAAAAQKLVDQNQRLVTKNEIQWQTYQAAQTVLDTAVRTYQATAVRNGIAAGTGADVYGIIGLTVTEGDLTTAIAAAEKQIEDLTRENTKLNDPNSLAREHQKRVYDKFDEEMTPPEKMKDVTQRASEIKDRKEEDYIVPEIYEQYPEAYIHTMRVMFGGNITDFSNAEEFKKATLMIPPEVFIQYIDTSLLRNVPNPPPPGFVITITDPYDPALKPNTPTSDIIVKRLSGKMMLDFHSKMMEVGAQGKLGELPPATVTVLEDIQQRTATDIFIAPGNPGGVAPADRNTLIDNLSKELYYFEDVNDLALRIWTRQSFGAGYGVGTAQIASVEDAKAYALEIARLRNS